MLRNRRPLNPEHQETHLPMGGLIRSRMKRLFAILGVLLSVQILIIWAAEDLSLFEAAWLTMTTLVTVGYGDYFPITEGGKAVALHYKPALISFFAYSYVAD